MARFELNLYDMATEKVEKTLQRNILPISLYLKFQEYSEKLVANEIKSDTDLYNGLCELFVELFPELTKEDYKSKTDPGEILVVFRNILNKATQFEPGKNV